MLTLYLLSVLAAMTSLAAVFWWEPPTDKIGTFWLFVLVTCIPFLNVMFTFAMISLILNPYPTIVGESVHYQSLDKQEKDILL